MPVLVAPSRGPKPATASILQDQSKAERVYAEHRRLVDAIKSGDPEFAGIAMRVHLTMVARTVEHALSQIELEQD
jgi:DNA-binding FadR family transcriptional regulator